MQSRNLAPGLLLIALGAIFLAGNLGAFSLLDLWPVLLIVLGLFFFVLWLRERPNYGLLMPASILVVVGLLFLYCQNNGWWYMRDLWPVFIIAPGVGFFLMYFLGEQEGGLLIPGSILLGVGLVIMSGNRWVGAWWPAVLIIIGVLLLLRPPKAWEFDADGGGSGSDTGAAPPPPDQL